VSFAVVSVRRYPVKALGGEALASVRLDARGLAGDRWFAVQDGEGHFASGKSTRRFRRRDGVFAYRAATDGDRVTVTGRGGSWTVGEHALDDELSTALATPVRVTPEGAVPHQDAGSVSLVGSATLRWCAERWGIDADARRLRANVVFDGGEPFVEESWVGRRLRIGTAVLTVVGRVERCRTIDVAQDGVDADGRWLGPLAAERQLRIAVYVDVTEPGTIGVGDALQVL